MTGGPLFGSGCGGGCCGAQVSRVGSWRVGDVGMTEDVRRGARHRGVGGEEGYVCTQDMQMCRYGARLKLEGKANNLEVGDTWKLTWRAWEMCKGCTKRDADSSRLSRFAPAPSSKIVKSCHAARDTARPQSAPIQQPSQTYQRIFRVPPGEIGLRPP
jgi:hypothetical protein